VVKDNFSPGNGRVKEENPQRGNSRNRSLEVGMKGCVRAVVLLVFIT
jgi:hypothetical protein